MENAVGSGEVSFRLGGGGGAFRTQMGSRLRMEDWTACMWSLDSVRV